MAVRVSSALIARFLVAKSLAGVVTSVTIHRRRRSLIYRRACPIQSRFAEVDISELRMSGLQFGISTLLGGRGTRLTEATAVSWLAL